MGHRPGDALVEIWNGMPFLSPVWYRGPRIVFLHHVHAEMWGMVLPPTLARMGDRSSAGWRRASTARSRIVTLSDSSRDEIVDMLGLAPTGSRVAPPGRRRPLHAGRPALADAPGGGGGPARAGEALRRAAAGAGHGEGRPPRRCGRSSSARATSVRRSRRCARSSAPPSGSGCPAGSTTTELVSWYRRAWVVASSSQREGWGMTLTEAAACGTPAVATAIAGHADAVVDGESGLLVDDVRRPGRRARACPGRRGAAQPAVQGRAGPGALVHLGRHGPPRPRGAGRGGDGSRRRRRRAPTPARSTRSAGSERRRSAVDADDRPVGRLPVRVAVAAPGTPRPGASRRPSGFGHAQAERRR